MKINLRLRAAGVHLVGSLAIAALIWWSLVRRWYPPPFEQLADGVTLFLLLASVDVVMGPLLTAVIASPVKSRRALMRDLAVIVVLQMVALVYGLQTLAQARPVALVHEMDLFRLVTAADLGAADLREAPPGMRHLSWRGPMLIATAKPANAAEQLRSIELAMNGIPLAMLPRYWLPYQSRASVAWSAGHSVAATYADHPNTSAALDAALRKVALPHDAVRIVPLYSRRAEWLAVVAAPDARVVAYVPIGGQP